VTPGLYGLSTQYTLLTASAISGQFAQFISSSPRSSFLSLSGPFYDATSVDVTMTRTPFGAVSGLTGNQRAVGNALEGAYSTTLTGPAAMLYTNLLMTGTPDALSQLSGERRRRTSPLQTVRGFPADGPGGVLAQRRDRRQQRCHIP
jgi:hypothetical protein